MANPVERLTSEWQLAPAAALSDLPYTGMAVMRWTCRTAVIRVECHDIYPNCPRYVPGFATGKASIYVPRPDRMPPAPEWKQLPAVAPLLPGNDQQGPTNDSAKG